MTQSIDGSVSLRELFKKYPSTMTVLFPNDGKAYEWACNVYNYRIKKRPGAIAFCENADHVSLCFKVAVRAKVKVTVRSGGHHHEGMCLNDGGIVIDVSAMEHGEVHPECNNEFGFGYAEFGPGRRLKHIIDDLTSKNRVIPVGGCQTVRIGGLVQGGGWGASYRQLGVTSDWLEEVDIVIPNGEILTLNKQGVTKDCKGKLPDDVCDNGAGLFRALRGGGGGNFGVVTRFKFQLARTADDVCSIWYTFHRNHRAEIIDRFSALMAKKENDPLTLACRLTVVDKCQDFDEDNPAIIIVGRYFGEIEDAKDAVSDLLEGWEEGSDYRGGVNMQTGLTKLERLRSAYLFSDYYPIDTLQDRERPAQAYGLNVGARSMTERISTCDFGKDRPEPHKVSSAFPKKNSGLSKYIQDFFNEQDKTPFKGRVNYYLTLHGMGGSNSVPFDDTAFPWRDMPMMLQIQAWWDRELIEDSDKYVQWVRDFRNKLQKYTTGAFINFPDECIPVADYYNGGYETLQGVKADYDPDEVLSFGLGIKPK